MDVQKLLDQAGFKSRRIEVPPVLDVSLPKQIVRYQLIYSLSGLLRGQRAS